MSVLLTCDSIAKHFDSRTVFTGISLSLHDNERLGVIGPNGAGKSTFLQILGGGMKPDEGTVSVRKGVRMALVEQDPRFRAEATIESILLAAAPESDERELEIAKLITRIGFENPSTPAGQLSGGWRKRLAIAQALAAKPDLLLLDEPTNHLDVEGILQLENILNNAPFASIFVTHDRYFLENVSTRVAEISRSWPLGLYTAPGNYSKFLEKRAEALRAQQREQEALENLVAREIEWLRRGAKARTTKSKARIQDAMELQQQLAEMTDRARSGSTSIDFTATGRMTKRLLVAEGLSKSLGGKALFQDVSFVLAPGAKLGILGANGTGKSTLLRILTGEIAPDAGCVTRAEGLRVAWFDQNREQLDLDQPLRRALAPDSDTVIFRGAPVHVAGWAARFLFRNEQLSLPVRNLSGGERARVHIARLMLQPADVLLLDEPTNDLDIPTLDILENNLVDFPGALVLVTHDRFMLDRLSSTLLALDGDGGTGFYAELSQWEQARATRKAAPKPKTASAPAAKEQPAAKKKLSYLEAREYEQIESQVMQAEETLAAHRLDLEKNEVVTDPARLVDVTAKIDAAQAEVDRLYARWSELESRKG